MCAVQAGEVRSESEKNTFNQFTVVCAVYPNAQQNAENSPRSRRARLRVRPPSSHKQRPTDWQEPPDSASEIERVPRLRRRSKMCEPALLYHSVVEASYLTGECTRKFTRDLGAYFFSVHLRFAWERVFAFNVFDRMALLRFRMVAS